MDSHPRLKIQLIRGWSQLKDPKSIRFFRETREHPGELQFSSAENQSGKLLTVTEENLFDLCRKAAAKVRGGRITLTRSGNCEFGLYATMVVRGEEPIHSQIWVLSDRKNFVFITHTCMKEPNVNEITEANEIALMTNFR